MMGTRSRIGVMHGTVCKSVYCHWDGYLEHNGAILQEHYDSAKANNLVALGDLSTLREHIVVPDGVDHSFEKPLPGITVFYGRDRGEEGTDFKVAHTFEEFLEQADNCGAEYYYVMENGKWYYGSMHESNPFYKRLVLLSEALQTEKEIA
jgi:hypothetical protein